MMALLLVRVGIVCLVHRRLLLEEIVGRKEALQVLEVELIPWRQSIRSSLVMA